MSKIKQEFPTWITKPPPRIEKLLTNMSDEVYSTIVREVLSFAEPYFRQKFIDGIEKNSEVLDWGEDAAGKMREFKESWWQQFKMEVILCNKEALKIT